MEQEAEFFGTIRIILLWMSPIVMVVGSILLLLSSQAYKGLENKLAKEIGGTRKKLIPLLENNIDVLHNWIIANKNIAGFFFIVCSLVFFLFLFG